MAASAWEFYDKAKEYIGDSTIDLDTDQFYLTLHTSASNCDDDTISSYASIDNEVSEANGYSSSGKSLTVTWATGASAGEMRFDATAVIWTASGGTISNVRYGVIRVSGGQVLCRAALTTSQFSVTDGNTLTITPSANGIFELN